MRLFWRIYLTVVVSLVVVAVLGGMLLRMTRDPPPRRFTEFAATAMLPHIPSPEANPEELNRSLALLHDKTGADLTLLSEGGAVIAEAGAGLPPSLASSRVVETPLGRVWTNALPDGRTLLVRFPWRARDLWERRLHFLLLVTIAVAIAAYPVVRRITRQLDRLRGGAASWGEGDLSARVPVEGADEIAQLAQTFNAAAERVEQLLAAHKQLLANASHEFRSPLARLRMGIEMFEKEPSPARKAEIVRNLEELDALVEEILLTSRLDHVRDAPPRELVDLLAVAAEEAAHTNAAVTGEPAEVHGEPRLLHRLVRNLLDNASRHGLPPVEVEVKREHDQAVLVVRDRGVVSQDSRERLFEPFYRGRAAEGEGGWGLGLALVRQIAERHGGNARCESAPGKGTAFIVQLPRA